MPQSQKVNCDILITCIPGADRQKCTAHAPAAQSRNCNCQVAFYPTSYFLICPVGNASCNVNLAQAGALPQPSSWDKSNVLTPDTPTKKHCLIQGKQGQQPRQARRNVLHWFAANHFTRSQVHIKNTQLFTIRWSNLLGIIYLGSTLCHFSDLTQGQTIFPCFIFGLEVTFPL